MNDYSIYPEVDFTIYTYDKKHPEDVHYISVTSITNVRLLRDNEYYLIPIFEDLKGDNEWRLKYNLLQTVSKLAYHMEHTYVITDYDKKYKDNNTFSEKERILSKFNH